MSRYKATTMDELQEKVPDDEFIVNMREVGEFYAANTEPLCERFTDKRLRSMDSAKLYSVAARIGADMDNVNPNQKRREWLESEVRERIKEVCSHG